VNLVSPPELVGIQEPRIAFAPPSVVTTAAAEDTADLCAAAGLVLDPWQVNALTLMLGEKADGDWAAFEFGYQAQRQNGKGGVLEARELGGLFLFGERDIIHSAHAGDTARKAFLRMRNIIDGASFLRRRVKRIIGAPGREHIELMDGRMLEYRTRTASGGRGFSGTPVILDEAQELTAAELLAIMPVVSAQPNPQLIYTGTVKAGAAVFQGVVERGRQRLGDALGYAEWSAREDADSDDVEAHRAANPAMGIRIAPGYIRNELAAARGAMAETEWRMERLGIWPSTTAVGQLIPVPSWTACRTDWKPSEDQLVEHVGIASSVDGAWSSVGVAFQHGSKTFVQVVKHEPGTAWVIPYVAGLVQRRQPKSVVMDKGGPASKSLANGLAAVLSARVLQETSTAEMQAATAQFIDAVGQQRIEHTGQGPLDAAAAGVREKLVGDARMYNRRKSDGVIAPVEAVTLAAWSLLKTTGRPSKYDTEDLLVLGG
jgi:hypothetical protein